MASNTESRNPTAPLLPRAYKQCVAQRDCSHYVTQPTADRLTGCSVRLQSWMSERIRPRLSARTELRPPNSETTSWLRFVCQSTVSRPVNSLCKVLFQLSLTVLVCYRCRSRITNSLTSSLPRTLSCTLKQLDSNKVDALADARHDSWCQCLHGMGLTPALAQLNASSCPKTIVIYN